jgi:hypothetical protein
MPGPAFTRPPTTDTGEQARRGALRALLDRRADALGAAVAEGTEQHSTVFLLAGLADAFVDSVERANSSRILLRQTPLDYVDAVVIDGANGQLVVDAVEYDAAPVHWLARAGEVTSVIHGADLDAYLRTGDTRYAVRLGLA